MIFLSPEHGFALPAQWVFSVSTRPDCDLLHFHRLQQSQVTLPRLTPDLCWLKWEWKCHLFKNKDQLHQEQREILKCVQSEYFLTPGKCKARGIRLPVHPGAAGWLMPQPRHLEAVCPFCHGGLSCVWGAFTMEGTTGGSCPFGLTGWQRPTPSFSFSSITRWNTNRPLPAHTHCCEQTPAVQPRKLLCIHIQRAQHWAPPGLV